MYMRKYLIYVFMYIYLVHVYAKIFNSIINYCKIIAKAIRLYLNDLLSTLNC